jgi:RNA polymerase sporulation-specific sigma factor
MLIQPKRRAWKGGKIVHNNHTKTASAYRLMSDEELAEMAASDDSGALEELISRYKNLVRARARSYFLAGADTDDIIQEGMIGLFKAIRDFNAAKQTVFSSFAELCVTRQIMTAVKTAARNKHLPLNTYISLNSPLNADDSERSLLDLITEETSSNPETLLIVKEQMAAIKKKIKSELSKFEQDVLLLYLNGHSYSEISLNLKTHVKSVDNALQRIKRKLSKSTDKKQ